VVVDMEEVILFRTTPKSEQQYACMKGSMDVRIHGYLDVCLNEYSYEWMDA